MEEESDMVGASPKRDYKPVEQPEEGADPEEIWLKVRSITNL